jgi:hypothetical protein
MIPQSFIKGGGERVFFGTYEYPAGADIVFDFGNPTCTSAFNSSRIVYNVGTANVTGSLIPTPSVVYPTLESTNGGIALFSAPGETAPITDANYMQWNWKSTQQQTNVFIYKPSTVSTNSGEIGFPGPASGSANSLYSNINGSQFLYNGAFDSSNTQYDALFGGPGAGAPQLDTGSLNGRNGWNTMIFSANASNSHYQYVNVNTSSFDGTTITRVDSGTQRFQLANRVTAGPNAFNTNVMAFLQYPRVLTTKEIRQINKVFAQRFFT